MLHAIMGLLDNSPHISSYVSWWVAWLGIYISSDKFPALEIGLAIWDKILRAHIATAEDLEFLDTPVHIHVHVVTMYKYKTIKMVLIESVRQNYSFTHIILYEMLLMWDYSAVGLVNFQIRKLLLKLRVHHSGKFAPRENNQLAIQYITNKTFNLTIW